MVVVIEVAVVVMTPVLLLFVIDPPVLVCEREGVWPSGARAVVVGAARTLNTSSSFTAWARISSDSAMLCG